MRRIWIRLRICFLLLIAIATAAVVIGIVYLSEVGLSQDARDRIALELERYGLYVSFQDLTYDFSNGLTARQVNLFSSAERVELMAQLPHLVIDIDRTKIMRGILKVNKVALKDADLSLPLHQDRKDGPKITISDINGEFYLPSKYSLETNKLTATWQGLDITLQGHIWRKKMKAKPPISEEQKDRNEQAYLEIIDRINQWDWNKASPPSIKLNLEGPINEPSQFHTSFEISVPELQYNGLRFYEVSAKGDFAQSLLTLDHIQFNDDLGSLTGKGDYLPRSKEGRFDLTSSIDFQRFSRTFFKHSLLPELKITGGYTVTAKGDFQAPSKQTNSHLHFSGQLKGKQFSYLNQSFDSLETAFSYKNGSAYLDDLSVKVDNKELKGKALAQGDIIRYQFHSNLHVDTYRPFLEGSPITKTLKRCTFKENSQVILDVEGTMNRSDVTDWSTKGNLEIFDFSYKGVPLNRLKGSISLNALLSRYEGIEADFDYQNYNLKKTHGGPNSALAKIQEIEFDKTARSVKISKISGKFWPAPFVRMFKESVANHIENYKFTRPPSITASGIFALPSSKRNTDFQVNVSSPDTTYYKFLKRDVSLRALKAQVKITKSSVSLPSISFRAFDGPIAGNLKVSIGSSAYSGFLKWTEIPLSSVNRTYQFSKKKNKGHLTGNIYFSGKGNNLSSFNAKSGTISLRKGTLFDVPVVGPLSPLIGQTIGKIIGNERLLHERAKDASCSFIIKNGIIYTNDFSSHTSSMNFTGQGKIDLNKETIDMTARMNIRGLLGFITLPLRPFTDTLFQFRGTGKINNANWNPAPFQAPPKNHSLFNKPPKATIVR